MREKGSAGIVFLVAMVALLAFACLGGLLLPYTVNSWLEFAGREPACTFWMGAVAGFVPVVGQLIVPAALITWIALAILGA